MSDSSAVSIVFSARLGGRFVGQSFGARPPVRTRCRKKAPLCTWFIARRWTALFVRKNFRHEDVPAGPDKRRNRKSGVRLRMDSAEAAQRSQAKLANSAEQLKQSAEQQTDSADRRTELAADRTILAAERTYAAWVRTGLAALAFGIGARAILDGLIPKWLVAATGSILILFAAACFMAAVWRQMLRVAPPRPDAPRIPAWLLVALNGFLLLVSLAALVGIWLQ